MKFLSMGFNSVSFYVWNEKKVKRSCQTLNFFCSIDRGHRDNAFYGVFEFQTSTSLATPARQKNHIVSHLGVRTRTVLEYEYLDILTLRLTVLVRTYRYVL